MKQVRKWWNVETFQPQTFYIKKEEKQTSKDPFELNNVLCYTGFCLVWNISNDMAKR